MWLNDPASHPTCWWKSRNSVSNDFYLNTKIKWDTHLFRCNVTYILSSLEDFIVSHARKLLFKKLLQPPTRSKFKQENLWNSFRDLILFGIRGSSNQISAFLISLSYIILSSSTIKPFTILNLANTFPTSLSLKLHRPQINPKSIPANQHGCSAVHIRSFRRRCQGWEYSVYPNLHYNKQRCLHTDHPWQLTRSRPWSLPTVHPISPTSVCVYWNTPIFAQTHLWILLFLHLRSNNKHPQRHHCRWSTTSNHFSLNHSKCP